MEEKFQEISKKKEDLIKANKFKKNSNLKAFTAIFRDYSFIFAIIFINIKFSNLYLYLISAWIIGAFQFAISETLLHESIHNNLFTSRKLNKNLEIILAVPFFTTFKDYKKEHLHHHNFLLQKTDHLYQDYLFFGFIDKNGNFIKNLNYFYHYFLRPILGFSGIYYFIANSNFKSVKVILFYAILTFSSIYFGFFKEFIFLWIIPFIWCGNAFLYWSEFSDHFNVKNGNTRTRISKFSNWIFHNNGYHMTHHQYPFISFSYLKKAYNEIHKNTKHDISSSFLNFYQKLKNDFKNSKS